MGEYAVAADGVDGTGMRVAIAVSRFNEDITEGLLGGARRTLTGAGVRDEDVLVVRVPGAFELPVVARQLGGSGAVDAVICLGSVIRGDTPHFEYVAGEAARGLQDAALATGVPVVFGILTTNTHEQALDRIGGSEGHKGEEAAATALEMIALLASLPGARD